MEPRFQTVASSVPGFFSFTDKTFPRSGPVDLGFSVSDIP